MSNLRPLGTPIGGNIESIHDLIAGEQIDEETGRVTAAPEDDELAATPEDEAHDRTRDAG